MQSIRNGIPYELRLRVGLLGCGTVGSPIANALLNDSRTLTRAAGCQLELARVAVRDPHRARSVAVPGEIITTDALAVSIDPDIDVVIEVMGGVDPALACIQGALGEGKAVITANNVLLGGPGARLLDDPDADLYFEAAVCGAIPIVTLLKEYCAADRVESLTGIFSGTCNFVLSTMTEEHCSFEEAVRRAQALGYAGSNPSGEIEALDGAAKVALLARVAFGLPITTSDVERQGICHFDQAIVTSVAKEGFVYKLVGHAQRLGDSIDAWVGPALLPREHPFAQVSGVDNAVTIQTKRAGQLRLHGSGAGGDETAAAVLADLVSAARRHPRQGAAFAVTIP